MMSCLINDTSTTSKRSIWPKKTRGLWVEGAWDSRLRLSNGKAYDDWASALGANTLGYDFFKHGPMFQPAASLPWQIERDFADRFCLAMDTEAVRFFKSGSDALSCAVRLARAFTGRSAVVVFDQSYHGTGDWFGPALWIKGGIVGYEQLLLRVFGQKLTSNEFFSDIAAIVVEPVPKSINVPPPGWLTHLREVCDEHRIILISDEVILGYRHGLHGFLRSVGLRGDLTCYGKAMGQGAAISACTGRRDLMEQLVSEVHFSGTNNGELLPLVIADETLRRYQEFDVPMQLDDLGQFLRDLLHERGFETDGLNERFEVPSARDATEYCFDQGILFSGWCSIAVSHTNEQCHRLVEVLCQWRKQGKS